MGEDSLPVTHNGWQRTRFELTERDSTSFFGEVSKSWTYASPTGDVAVSFDYPFNGWHELSGCYRGHGWNVVRRTTDDPDNQSTESPFVEVEFTKPSGEHGYLLFGLLDAAGQPVQPPNTTTSLPHKLMEKVLDGPLVRLFDRNAVARAGLDLNTYQMQTFATASHRLSVDERAAIREQFQSFCRILRDRFEKTAL